MIAARYSALSARTRRIPAADRSRMCIHLPACLSESESVRPWNWMVAKLKLSLSSRDRCRLAAES